MFVVSWDDRALGELAGLWRVLDLAAREALLQGIAALNARLAADPFDEGESRDEGWRVTFIGRVAIAFEVDPGPGVVTVGRLHAG